MRISDLHPQCFGVLSDPRLNEFVIDCPLCGRRLMFKALFQRGHDDKYHGATFDVCDPWNTITVEPSLRFPPGSAHGTKVACAPHFTITNGEVALS